MVVGSRIAHGIVAWLAVTLCAAPAAASILIVSPHPDDDIILDAGVTRAALLRGETVRVVYLTNGDFEGLEEGDLRQDEAVAAQELLGNVEGNLIFLGYPDFYLDEIYLAYPQPTGGFTAPNGQSETYAHRGLGGVDYHTFRTGSPALYNRPNLVGDLTDVLETYQPEHVFVTSHFDLHRDHALAFTLVEEAAAGAAATVPGYEPAVYEGIVHGGSGWPVIVDPTAYTTQPPILPTTSLVWSERAGLDVPQSMQRPNFLLNLKAQALDRHVTQGGSQTFAARVHKDEVFWISNPVGANQPPVPRAGLGQTVVEGAAVQLDGTASFDPESAPLSFAWTQTAGMAVSLSDPADPTPGFTAPTGLPADEVLVFELAVGDGVFSSVPDSVAITVQSSTPQPNDPPFAYAGPNQIVAENVAVHLDGTGSSDPNGDPISYLWTQISGIPVVLSDPDTAMPSFTSPSGLSEDAVLVFRLIVDDGDLGSAPDFVTITVLSSAPPGNGAPFADAGPDQTANPGDAVELDGTGSSDPEGDPISYQWTQIAGTPVTLLAKTQATAGFAVPSGIAADEILRFLLVVSDGQAAEPDEVQIYARAAPSNVAPRASSSASSEALATSQGARKATDQHLDGYPGDHTREWSSAGETAGAWLELTWPQDYDVARVVLWDRPNSADCVTAATLHFSDGSTVPVGALDNDGGPVEVAFPPRATRSLRITVDSVSASTMNAGLAEIEVFGAPAAPAGGGGPGGGPAVPALPAWGTWVVAAGMLAAGARRRPVGRRPAARS